MEIRAVSYNEVCAPVRGGGKTVPNTASVQAKRVMAQMCAHYQASPGFKTGFIMSGHQVRGFCNSLSHGAVYQSKPA